MPRILCTIGKEFALEGQAILKSLGTVEYAEPNQKQLLKIIAKYDVIVTQLGLHFDACALKHATNLKILATATTGTDHIDLAAAKKQGITVLSLKESKKLLKEIPSTAEHAWGLLLTLLRNTVPATQEVHGGSWDGKLFAGTELKGKTLGIIGVGRLGTMVAKFGKAFGMNVMGYDIKKIASSVCQQVFLDTLLKRSDVISLHVHLDPKTQGMIGARELRLMKPSAVVINTARGGIVDEAALLAALKTKRIAGYAADVLGGEAEFDKNCSKDPLVRYSKTHGNVLITPHIGGRTKEARRTTDIAIARQVRDAL